MNTSDTQGTVKSYVLGFLFSLLLTLASFFVVFQGVLAKRALSYTIIGLALLQALIQVFLFLHLGKEDKPRWKVLTFLFMLSVVLIIVLGSLWIMSNLDYNLMPRS